MTNFLFASFIWFLFHSFYCFFLTSRYFPPNKNTWAANRLKKNLVQVITQEIRSINFSSALIVKSLRHSHTHIFMLLPVSVNISRLAREWERDLQKRGGLVYRCVGQFTGGIDTFEWWKWKWLSFSMPSLRLKFAENMHIYVCQRQLHFN